MMRSVAASWADKKMIGTQMNADFQDSNKLKMFFIVYLNKSDSL
jgi:hypothetical protein